MKDNYHFHKDCKYFSQCTEEIMKEGKQRYVRFTCPAIAPQTLKYYLGDVHTIKISCAKFEPYQNNISDFIATS